MLAYRAENWVEARALAVHLEGAGIQARVVGDYLGGAHGGIQAGTMLATEVWIPATDRAGAEALIAAWDAEHHPGRVEAIEQPIRFSLKTAFLTTTAAVLLAASMSRHNDELSTFASVLLVLFLMAMGVLVLRR